MTWLFALLESARIKAAPLHVCDINPRCHFHQLFTRARFLYKSAFLTPKFLTKALRSAKFCTKNARVKCWWNWRQVVCLENTFLEWCLSIKLGKSVFGRFFLRQSFKSEFLHFRACLILINICIKKRNRIDRTVADKDKLSNENNTSLQEVIIEN